MSVPLLTTLETLAAEMRRRGWVARAALVSDAGDVLSLCPAPFGPASDRDVDGRVIPGTVAHLAVVPIDGTEWLYIDLDVVRWMASVESGHDAANAASWLTLELQKLGVTVERDLAARD